MSHANRSISLTPLLAALFCVALAACGGGGGGGSPSTGNNSNPPPADGGTTNPNPTYGSVSQPTLASRLNKPAGIALDSTGNVYVADQGNFTIRRISTTAGVTTITTVAGVAGTAGSADGPLGVGTLSSPNAVAVTPTGVLFVADGSTLRKIDGGTMNTIIGSGNLTNASGVAVVEDAVGDQTVYVTDSTAGNVVIGKATGDIITLTGLTSPRGIAVDAAGLIYVTDVGPDGATQIKKITPPDLATAPAGAQPANVEVIGGNVAGQTFVNGAGIAVTPTGDVVFVQPTAIVKLSGTTATTVPVNPAVLKNLFGLAIDSAGNYIVSDYDDHTVSTVDATNGNFATIAGMAGQAGNVD